MHGEFAKVKETPLGCINNIQSMLKTITFQGKDKF